MLGSHTYGGCAAVGGPQVERCNDTWQTQCGEAVGAASHERQDCAAASQLCTECSAESAGRAGEQHRRAVEGE